MIKNSFLLIMVIALLYSCKSPEKINNPEDVILNKIEIELPESELFLAQYLGNNLTKSIIYTKDNEDFIAFYNSQIHSIDIIDVKNRKGIKQIYLQKEGPNAIVFPSAFHFYKGGFLFITKTGYCLVNEIGEVIQKKDFSIFEEIQSEEYSYDKPPFGTFSFFNYFPFDNLTGTIGIPLYPSNINKKIISQPLIIKLLSFETGQVETISIPYPEEFSKKEEWGFLNNLHICFNKDLYLINLAGSSDVYIYNRTNKDFIKKTIPSYCIPNLILPKAITGPEEGRESNNGSRAAGYYFPLQYDSHRDVYWRIQIGPAHYLFDLKRTFTITKIAPDFNSWEEIKLPGDGSHYLTLFPVETGIWIEDVLTPENEDILTLWEIPLIN